MISYRYTWMIHDYIESVVDQREYQRAGGTCWRNPFSCFMCHAANILLQQYMNKTINDAVILDGTYGEGRFWKACKKRIRMLIGVDIYDRKKIVAPDIFIKGDIVSSKTIDALREYAPFDLIVIDPPYSTGITSTYARPADHANSFQWERIVKNIDKLATLQESSAVLLVKGMIRHGSNGIDYATTPFFISDNAHSYRLMHILYYRIIHRRRTTVKRLVYNNYVYVAVLVRK